MNCFLVALTSLTLYINGHNVTFKPHSISYINGTSIYSLWADRPNQVLIDLKPLSPLIMADITQTNIKCSNFSLKQLLLTDNDLRHQLRNTNNQVLTKIFKSAAIQNNSFAPNINMVPGPWFKGQAHKH